MNTDRLYPSSTDDGALANTFAEKISKIRTSIQGAKCNLGVTSLSFVTSTARLSSLSQVNCSVVHELLTGLTKKLLLFGSFACMYLERMQRHFIAYLHHDEIVRFHME